MCRRSDVGMSAQEKGIWSRWLAAVGREDIASQTGNVQMLQTCCR